MSDALLRFDDISNALPKEFKQTNSVESSAIQTPTQSSDLVAPISKATSTIVGDFKNADSSPPSGVESKQQLQSKATNGSSSYYDYQYEFSETRKVLDEFFKPSPASENIAAATDPAPEDDYSDINYTLRRRTEGSSSYSSISAQDENLVQQQLQPKGLATLPKATLISNNVPVTTTATTTSNPSQQQFPGEQCEINNTALGSSSLRNFSDASPNNKMLVPQVQPPSQFATASYSGSSGDTGYATLNSPEASRVMSSLGQHPIRFHTISQPVHSKELFQNHVVSGQSRNYTLSPETTDCDSADLESEVNSVNEGSFHSSGPKMHTAMPILEDGLSSGHASDLEEDVIYSR